MITILNGYYCQPFYCKVCDLTEDNFDLKKNAFIGKCGDGPDNSLYIVTYDCISLLENTERSWSSDANVTVRGFVDLEIRVKTCAHNS